MPSRSIQRSLAGEPLAGETNVTRALRELNVNTPKDRQTNTQSPPNAPLRRGGRGKVLRHIVYENRLREYIHKNRNGEWVPRGRPFSSKGATKAKKAEDNLFYNLCKQLCDRFNHMDNCRRELSFDFDDTDGTDGKKRFRSDSI